MFAKLLGYFEEHRAEVSAEHKGKFVLIHARNLSSPCEILGFHSTFEAAYGDAIDEKGLELGHFLIQQCVLAEEEVPLMFYSRVR